MNVAIIVRIFPNVVQTYVLNHILGLKQEGVTTNIISERYAYQPVEHPLVSQLRLINETDYIDTKPAKLINAITGIPYRKLKYWKSVVRIMSNGIWFKRGLLYTFKSIIRVQIISKYNLDIVHAHSLFGGYDYLFLKEVFNVPIVVSYHGSVPESAPNLSERKMHEVFEACDALMVNTRYAMNQLLEMNCDPSKIKVIPQATNTSRYRYTERSLCNGDHIVIASIGRLSKEKGHDIAIQALRLISLEYPKIIYHVIGDGPEKSKIMRLGDICGVGRIAIFHGYLAGRDLDRILASSHILVHPSLDETQGVVLQEAQAIGIPVIASRVGGIPEVIEENETGLLFNKADPVDLYLKIKQLIENPVLYQKLSRNGRADVENNYSLDAITPKILGVYQALLS